MKTDDFEQRLQRQPLRQAPSAWRPKVLGAARAARVAADARLVMAASPRLRAWPMLAVAKMWRELFRPSRFAWGGIAATWLFMLIVNEAIHGGGTSTQVQAAPPTADVLQAAQAQRRMLAELSGHGLDLKIDHSRSERPRPHSRRETEIAFA